MRKFRSSHMEPRTAAEALNHYKAGSLVLCRTAVQIEGPLNLLLGFLSGRREEPDGRQPPDEPGC